MRRYSVQQRLVEILGRRGAAVLLIAPGQDRASLATLADRIDGLLFAGGTDLHPGRYGAVPEAGVRYDLERDVCEAQLVELALVRDLPLLAICRGLQLLNVVLGGTLHVECAGEGPELLEHRLDWHSGARHPVAITPGSRLGDVLGAERVDVNSWHRQGVRELGRGLAVVGRSPDGVVEAIEHPGRRFAVGVQWHPEWLDDDPIHRNLVDRFVAESSSLSELGDP